MPAISFHQGVALAFGAFIDPILGNYSFNLVGENTSTSFNVTNAYGTTIFGKDPTTSKPNNRLRCLFHAFSLPVNQTSSLDFAAIPQLGELASTAYTLVSRSTAIDDAGLTGYDTIFTGYNNTHKQLDYIAGGDINGNNSVTKIERAYHRTGLAIWNKLKK